VSLFRHGLDAAGGIVGAEGFNPYLREVGPTDVARVRDQIILIDHRNETDLCLLRAQIRGLPHVPAKRHGPLAWQRSRPPRSFRDTPARTRRRPISDGEDGFFVIELDRATQKIIIRHYWPDLAPGYRAAGSSAERLLLRIPEAGLATDAAHAGYLGGELAKAEAALRLGLHFEQDRPLSAAGNLEAP
jgi:hypothetical protein